MPRYYFNLCSEEAEVTDLVGESCDNDVAALGTALQRAGEVVQKRLFRNESIEEGWIAVEDEAQREVLRLPLRAAAY